MVLEKAWVLSADYVQMHVGVCICVLCGCACRCMYTCALCGVCMYVYVRIYVGVCMCAYMYTCTYVWVCVGCIYTRVSACVVCAYHRRVTDVKLHLFKSRCLPYEYSLIFLYS